MLFVVVALIMDSIVVLFILISTTLVIPVGMLAPPYHLNYSIKISIYKATSTTYALRGGGCSNGFSCGFAFVGFGNASGSAYWFFGAALSFKLKDQKVYLNTH